MERSLAQVMARSGPRSSSTAAPPAKQSDSAVTKPVPLSRPSRSSQPAVPATPLPPPPLPPPQRLGLGATEASTPATVTTEWTPTSGAGGSTTMVPPTLLTAGGSVATTPSSTATTTAETTAAATPLLNSATFVVPTSKGNASHDDHTHLTRSDITTETAILAELAELVAGTYSEQQQQRHQGSSGSDSNKGALPHEHQVRGQPLMAPPSPCGTVIAPSFSHLSK
ncbi:hypothetical protein BC828DRAFT_28374 [Blastocladiella britannica]|nr:hypothetical protein BC828DRAFT_28374 [Blastocladiella britannica]